MTRKRQKIWIWLVFLPVIFSSLARATVHIRLAEVRNDLSVNGKLHTDLQVRSAADEPKFLNSLTADIYMDSGFLTDSPTPAINWQISPEIGYMRTVVNNTRYYRIIIANIGAYDETVLSGSTGLKNGFLIDSQWKTLVTLEFIIRETGQTLIDFDSLTTQIALFETGNSGTTLTASEENVIAEAKSVILTPVPTDSAQIRLRICRNDSVKYGIVNAALEMKTSDGFSPHRLKSLRCEIFFEGEGLTALPLDRQSIHLDSLVYETKVNQAFNRFHLSVEHRPNPESGNGLMIDDQWIRLATLCWEISDFGRVGFSVEKSTLYADYHRESASPTGMAVAWLLDDVAPERLELRPGSGKLLFVRLLKRNENNPDKKLVLDLQLKSPEPASLWLESFLCSLSCQPVGSETSIHPDLLWSVDSQPSYKTSFNLVENRYFIEVCKDQNDVDVFWTIEEDWRTLLRMRWADLKRITLSMPEGAVQATYRTSGEDDDTPLSGSWIIRNEGSMSSEHSIDLADFYASEKNRNVYLHWTTLGESDNSGFYIFRSEHKDGVFKQVNKAIIPGEMNSVKKKEYSYKDVPPELNKSYYYKLANVNVYGNLTYHGPVEPIESKLPHAFFLEQNHPNPFNASTTIPFTIYKAGHVRMIIYNIRGQQVNMLCDKKLEAGKYTLHWDGRDHRGIVVPSGTYFYTMRLDGNIKERRMQLIK
jgi:hypothetical protein